MAGLVTASRVHPTCGVILIAIHVLLVGQKEGVDARREAGHDEWRT